MTIGTSGRRLLDLSGDDGAVQVAQIVLDHDRIHALRPEKLKTIVAIGGCQQSVAFFLQQAELSRIAVYAE
jgi:hypothetical protein